MLLWHVVKLPWTEVTFIGGTKCTQDRADVNDEERAGLPSTSTTDENIDEVKKIALAIHRIVREISEDLSISIGSCHSIFTNDLRPVAVKFMPKLLNFD